MEIDEQLNRKEQNKSLGTVITYSLIATTALVVVSFAPVLFVNVFLVIGLILAIVKILQHFVGEEFGEDVD